MVDVFKWIVENPIVIETILGIALGIKAVSVALGIYNAVMEIATAVSLPLIAIIVAIASAIVAVILIQQCKH